METLALYFFLFTIFLSGLFFLLGLVYLTILLCGLVHVVNKRELP